MRFVTGLQCCCNLNNRQICRFVHAIAALGNPHVLVLRRVNCSASNTSVVLLLQSLIGDVNGPSADVKFERRRNSVHSCVKVKLMKIDQVLCPNNSKTLESYFHT